MAPMKVLGPLIRQRISLDTISHRSHSAKGTNDFIGEKSAKSSIV